MTRPRTIVPTFRLLAIATSVALLAAGCLPAALDDARPDAAVIGAPADGRAPGAAEGLDEALRRLATGHDFASSDRMRFLEVRSGLVGSQVIPGAARIARTSSADVAVVVRPASLTREILDPEERPTERLVLQLDVVLVRASDAREVGRLAGPRLILERDLPSGVLPKVADDPLVRSAVATSIDDLAPRVATELRSLAVSGSSGG